MIQWFFKTGSVALFLALGLMLGGCGNDHGEGSTGETFQNTGSGREGESLSGDTGSQGGDAQREDTDSQGGDGRKEVVKIGVLQQNHNLTQLVQAFNKANDKYTAEIQQYYGTELRSQPDGYEEAVRAMDLDITSGDAPDIIETNLFDAARFSSMGAIDDLFPYLEKSENISKEDIIDTVVRANTVDDAMVSINPYFSLSTIFGDSREFDGEGWTLAEMTAYASKHPGQDLFYQTTQRGSVYFLLCGMKDSFIDEETGKCSFDTPEFRGFLEMAKSFDKQPDLSSGGESEPAAIQSGKVLLSQMNLNTFKDIQIEYEIFGGNPIPVGFPTFDGSLGCEMRMDSVYSISARSDQKEGAWAFLEYVLMNPEENSESFPVLKSCFDQRAQEAVEVVYQTDANGNQIEIVMGVNQTILSDGWTMEYHTPRQEEVDLIRKLVAAAKPRDYSFIPVLNIVAEEADAFFNDAKTAEETAKIIQSRVQLYLDEQ